MIRRTGAESAKEENGEEKERELYPPPLLWSKRRNEKGVRDSKTKGKRDKKTKGGRTEWDTEKGGISEGKHPYERQREGKRETEHKACF